MTEPQRRQRRKTLTDRKVSELPRKRKRYILADPEQRGMYVRVPPQGPCVFAVVARSPYGKHKQVWVKIGTADVLTIEQARDKAREAIKRIKQGQPAFEPPPVRPDTVADVVATWLKRHVEAKGLRTGDELKRVLERYVLPVWRDRTFADLKRSDIARLLDSVEDNSGAWVADSVLAALRNVSSWYASRSDVYTPPFVKNMRRTTPEARKRSRMLSDDELAKVWKTAEADAGPFGAFVRVLLLTGQRREKIASMKWDDVSEDGTWTIATAAREKGNPGVLRLPPQAMKIIAQQPRLAASPYVFTGRYNEAISGFSHRHNAFKTACNVHDWSLHDCRRTARSLLSRSGVQPHIAERTLGHSVGGAIGQTYDRHPYTDEIADALARLARLITQIVDGERGDNVVPLRAPAV